MVEPGPDRGIHGAAPGSLRLRHLAAAGLALALLLAALLYVDTAARRLAGQAVHALAPQQFSLKNKGLLLQSAALAQPDLLPVFGASEVADTPGPYQAHVFFGDYPTGFTTFEVAHQGVASLIEAQDLAALGNALRGKKVVIEFSPLIFLPRTPGADSYDANFSALHGSELAFNLQLDWPVKQQAARRMLQYPQTLSGDPLLRFALLRLAGGSPVDRALYILALPLGKLQVAVQRLQDDWATIQTIWQQKDLDDAALARHADPLDWPALLRSAAAMATQQANNNPYGFDNQEWVSRYRDEVAHGTDMYSDGRFARELANSAEWTDFDTLLQILHQMGAHPLILSMPINGTFWDSSGVPQAARAAYYQKINQAVQGYDVQLIDFADHDADRYFSQDPWSHTSAKGWAYIDQALDEFYHSADH